LTLNIVMGKLVAGFVLAPAFAMGLSSVDPDNLLGCVANIEIYILAGSLSVIWITLSILFPGGFTWGWIQTLGKKFGTQKPAPPTST